MPGSSDWDLSLGGDRGSALFKRLYPIDGQFAAAKTSSKGNVVVVLNDITIMW